MPRLVFAAIALIFLSASPLKETFVPATKRTGQFISRLPLHFEAQGDSFVARTPRYAVSFALDEALISSPSGELRLRMEGANPRALEGVEIQAGRTNFFLGNEPAKWRTNVAQYARVRYRQAYPGIDAVYYGNQRDLEYDFVVAPHADSRAIRLRFDGAESVRITSEGELAIATPGGELRQRKPVIYQESGGARRLIDGGYAIRSDGTVGFEVGAYDPSQTLVIDPVLSYSTYLGGTLDETARAIAVDSSGNTYIAGRTSSTRFVTQVPAPTAYRGGVDVFVAKVNPAGNALIYLTYIGGTGLDSAFDIAVDLSGSAYVVGQTNSTDLPTVRPIQSTVRGTDGFVLKLNPAGDALVYSTYLGGSGTDIAEGVALDFAGSAYATGFTQSSDFPTRGPISRTLSGSQDAFVSKLAVDGASLTYSTYLGGSGIDIGTAIAVDFSGAAYVTGATTSANFPVMFPFQATRRGPSDVFVTKLNPSGAALLYSTYFGGSGDENPGAIALDSDLNVYVTGSTASTDLFVVSAAQSTLGGAAGGFDAFVVKADFSGIPIYSTYLGGSSDEQSLDIAADEAGNAYVVGSTASSNFPVLGALQPSRGNDGFVTQLSPTGALRFSTWLGGNGSDAAIGVALDAQNNILVTGLTSSADFPVMAPIQSTYGGAASPTFGDAFLAKISPAGGPSSLSMVPSASFAGDTVAPDSIVAAFGQGLAAALVIAGSDFPTVVGGVTVRVADSAGGERLARIYFVSSGQINFVMPAGTATGTARVDILRDGQVAASGNVKVERVAPALYTANSNGRGPAAALFLRVAANGAQTSGLTFQCPSAGNCANLPLDPGSASDQLFVLLFGTGIRGQSNVSATIGGQTAEVLGAVAQGEFPAFDQVNLRVARGLIGRGEVNVVLAVDGKAANTITLNIGGTLPAQPPSLSSLNPTTGTQGQTIGTLTINGQNLAGVNALEFSPAADIIVSNIVATATSVTARVAIGVGAATGTRTLAVVSPAGRSNTLTFTVNASTPTPAISEYFPVKTGLAWDYKVTFPTSAVLPYQPIVEEPAGLLCSNIFCGTLTFPAGDINFSMAVNQSLGVINGGESFRLTVTDPGPRFYFAGSGPMEMRVRTVSGSPQLELIQTLSTIRLVRPVVRPTPAELVQTQSLTVAAGTFPDVVHTVVTLVGNGIDLRGTFTTDVYLARGVGLIKAEMKDSTGKTLFTQELTRFTQPAAFTISNLRAGPSTFQSGALRIPITVDFNDPSGGTANATSIRVNFNVNNANVEGFTTPTVTGATPGQTSGTLQFTLVFQGLTVQTGRTLPITISLTNSQGTQSNTLAGTFQTQ